MGVACAMVCTAKNNRPSETGYSPSMRVFGKGLRWTGSTVDARIRGFPKAEDYALDADPTARRAAAIRSAAEVALSQMEADDKWRWCLAEAPIPPVLEYTPGAQIMFWSKARSDRWTGPAVVLGAAHRRGGDLEADGGQDLGTRRNYW
eukprot:2618731-Amphidinium_carterae.1